MKNIHEILIENLTNERLDKIVFRDKEFRLADKKLNKALKLYDKLSLPEDDAKVVSRVFDAYAAQSARYVSLAYRQGMKDTVKFLKKVEVM